MWRIEHNSYGPVDVTIVRKDKGVNACGRIRRGTQVKAARGIPFNINLMDHNTLKRVMIKMRD
jgi:hypothetical protein